MLGLSATHSSPCIVPMTLRLFWCIRRMLPYLTLFVCLIWQYYQLKWYQMEHAWACGKAPLCPVVGSRRM
ncbi:hypothetical protein EJ04DRAFT_172603 [Polyplosphaeria fusca]|uniref:Uncharacterized protein n=1 Tax=Polyplosphaeria fusca TaxID=682080 RepID=A0A9P4V4B3_9PLEO|nr:hypothetical protein EJ04DRAFT_172603 [Polyplosphaeria fusca]